MSPANSFLLGIDVSSHQGAVDWNAVSQANISFAYTRASVGQQNVDTQFATNWSGMAAAGLTRGAYHLFWPTIPALAQANHYAQTIGPLATGDLPPMVDLETVHASQNPNQDLWSTIAQANRLPMIQQWLAAVEQALGLKPLIYTNKPFIENLVGADLQQLSDYPLWIAQYTGAPQPNIPAAWTDWSLWQYSETGQVSGVSTAVDMDRFNGALSDLQALAKS